MLTKGSISHHHVCVDHIHIAFFSLTTHKTTHHSGHNPRSQSSINVPQVRPYITASAPASTVALLSIHILSPCYTLFSLFCFFFLFSSRGVPSHSVTVAGSSAFLGFHLLKNKGPEKKVFLVKICGLVFGREQEKKEKMNSYSYYGYQEKNTLTSCEETRMESVICPKPRRLGLINHSSINTEVGPSRHPIIRKFSVLFSFWFFKQIGYKNYDFSVFVH
ncbi:hypothetical protein GmHk_05G014578 [Glycine max]|nr:hypothetical protein GmHk_05G014578 [Glycine max]